METQTQVNSKRLSPEQKEANKLARREAKKQAEDFARIESEKNQKPVKSINIEIEWVRSRTWGFNPRCVARVSFQDGSYESSPVFSCSGCGYDKESTVIADVFNTYLKYKLWLLTPEQLKGGHGSNDKGNAPYGICIYSENRPHYGGGIGTNCYNRIAEYIGGKFESVAHGKSYDNYKYTDGQKAKETKIYLNGDYSIERLNEIIASK